MTPNGFEFIRSLRLADPWLLLLLLVPLALAVWLWRRRGTLRPRLRYSALGLFAMARPTPRTLLAGLAVGLLLAALALIAAALARPQSAWREHNRFTEGIDIMLVTDVSDSMHALDFTPNRLERSKEVMKEFISGRKDDQIGIVIFGKDTFALAPLTHDYQALLSFVDRIDFDLLDGSGTAIGMGLANAVNRLKDSQAKSKVIILLTDGENNAGKIDPLSAAGIAKEFKIRVYTIGVGTEHGTVPVPMRNAFGFMMRASMPAALDVAQLTQIAGETGGQFFHAKDDSSLEQIYRQIDQLERTKVEVSETHYFDDLAPWLIWPALLLLLLAFGLETTWLRTFP